MGVEEKKTAGSLGSVQRTLLYLLCTMYPYHHTHPNILSESRDQQIPRNLLLSYDFCS